MTLFIVGMIVLRLLCLAFFILLAVRLVVGFRARYETGALAILRQNYANGLITAEGFRQKRTVLNE